MRFIKGMLLGLFVGTCVGAWFGVNIGRDAPLLSNPFKERTIVDRVKDSASDAYEKSRDSLKKAAE